MISLEPLAIFGHAAGTMQVISFSHEAISTYKRIFEDNSPEQRLVQTAAQIHRESTVLQGSLNKHPQLHTNYEAELNKIAEYCVEACSRLSNEADDISSDMNIQRGKIKQILRAVRFTTKRI